MAQTTILAVGNTAATSTDIVVAAGSTVTVSLFTTSGPLPAQCVAPLWLDTPGQDLQVKQLSAGAPMEAISAPGTYRVTRVEGQSFGVFTES